MLFENPICVKKILSFFAGGGFGVGQGNLFHPLS